tara:strand:+ start:1207 stop:1674 length:468 start_codon:yes stop_codon:yes gene_type:complete
MKTYKELQEKIDTLIEGEETVGGAARSAHSDFGVHRIEHPEQVGRLNAFLNAFTQMEFLDPKSAIATMRHKLNLAGLDFDWNNFSTFTPEETLKLPLSRWGGSFGTTPTHDLSQGFYKGDNIAEFNDGKSISLNIDIYQEDSGLYQMDAKIVPTS